MTPIGHPRKSPRRLFQLSLSLHWLLVLATSLLLFACAGPSVEPDWEAPLLVVDDTLPLPVEGEQIDLKAIEKVTRLARTDSLLQHATSATSYCWPTSTHRRSCSLTACWPGLQETSPLPISY